MNCRIPDQERAHGRICDNEEYWVERDIHGVKRKLDGRGTNDPELVAGNDILLEEAAAKCECAGHVVKTFDELVPEYRSQEHRGRNLDEGDAEGYQCIGSGREVKTGERGLVLDVLRQVIQLFCGSDHLAWTPDKIANASLLEYRRADVRGKEIVFSTSYAKAKKSISWNVFVRYGEPGRGGATTMREYVCTVHRFIKASAEGCPPIRFGIGDLYKLKRVGEQFGTLWVAEDFITPREQNYGVMLEHMLWKLVTALPGEGADTAWFMAYGVQSGR
jgi:hypothetical protein